ncbi:F-box domain-containing protein [Caenorhabditis elegans]|uniref:F-box domain-containing protein n=1 Tax=Caenorhabditis elegans TaxID=6239 RepID=O44863_CAEEL|nr:F-box domain-containing protein [Caenorhabditis elegans]CCD72675.2 F-box domain-containing protein [Caenorhabditis elegans]|eukprot:NP_001309510.1 F-box B protein [Caenorhabditis elegans]
MAAVSSFPLHRLPQKTLKDVIGKMEIFEQACFSMVSRKTKNLIKEFGNFKGSKVEMEFLHPAPLLHIWNSRKEHAVCMFAFGHVTLSVSSRRSRRSRLFSTPRLFDTRSWFNHLMDILQPSKLNTLNVENPSDEFDESKFKMIKKCLKGRKICLLSIQRTPRMENILKLVNVFSEANELQLSANEQLDSSQLLAFRQILQMEHHNLYLSNLSLNNLLITRSSVIETENSTLLTEKNINLILKHWIAGLKPELKYLSVQLRGPVFNKELVFEGIPHKIASSRRTFRLNNEDDLLRAGGIDFYLGDGIKATAVFEVLFGNAKIIFAAHNSEFISFM